MKLAIIPARGGSTRIPRKNVRTFAGKPMIAWSIQAARDSGCFEHLVVSTDDEEIAEVAKRLGAEVPFIRPAGLSDSRTPIGPVILHGIEQSERLWGRAEFVCCVYATAPFVRAADIKLGADLLAGSVEDFALAVTTFAYPIQRALRINADHRVEMLWPEHVTARSQDLEEAYHDAGQFYWGRRDAFFAGTSPLSGSTIPIVLPRYRVQDVDTAEDWQRAELLFETLRLSDKLDPLDTPSL